MPYKVLTFGTGVFLRGFFCDFADRAGIPVVMASSTPDGDRRAEIMTRSGGRFTLAVRGVGPDGKTVDSWRTVRTIERVIPSTAWEDVLALARDPDFSVVVSNVSEAGFRLSEDGSGESFDNPTSFPARLTRWLWERWQTLGNKASVTVLPCELFAENGTRLRAMIEEVADGWQLDNGFRQYLQEQVTLPDTLVDRIVPGDAPPQDTDLWRERLGDEADAPIIVAEPYTLWAIRGDADLAARLGGLVTHSDGGVVVAPDITVYTLKKVRLLNGLHTAMAAIGPVQYGVMTTREAVEHPELGPLLHDLLYKEILPTVAPQLGDDEARAYADQTWARMRNPFLVHKLADINKGAQAKWPQRLHPTMQTYREQFGTEPPLITRCWHASGFVEPPGAV